MKWMECLQSDINVECKNGVERKSKREKVTERDGERDGARVSICHIIIDGYDSIELKLLSAIK